MKVPLGIVVKVFLCLYQHNPHALFFFFCEDLGIYHAAFIDFEPV